MYQSIIMEFEEKVGIIQFFKNIPDSDIQKQISDGINKFELIGRDFKPEKYSKLSEESINKLQSFLTKWHESTRNQSSFEIIEGFKYILIRWVILNPNITTDQLSEDTLDLLEKFDRYYEVNKNRQIIF